LRLRQFRGYAIGVWKEEQKKENNEGSEYGGSEDEIMINKSG
jgi:hypothetical protein